MGSGIIVGGRENSVYPDMRDTYIYIYICVCVCVCQKDWYTYLYHISRET
jgi:hypothetical protein